jgi:hypothetical protein
MVGSGISRFFAHFADTRLVRKQTGKQACPCWTTSGTIVKLRKADAFAGQFIKIGCRDFAAKTTDIGITHIIGHNKHNVGPLLGKS